MISEAAAATKIHMVKKKPVKQHQTASLGVMVLGDITRALRTVRNLKGKVYVVGGVVTEGRTARDIDIIVTKLVDIPKLKKALGKYSKAAHFMLQKKEPPAPLFVKVTGKEPHSVELIRKKKGKKLPPFEYASTASFFKL